MFDALTKNSEYYPLVFSLYFLFVLVLLVVFHVISRIATAYFMVVETYYFFGSVGVHIVLLLQSFNNFSVLDGYSLADVINAAFAQPTFLRILLSLVVGAGIFAAGIMAYEHLKGYLVVYKD